MAGKHGFSGSRPPSAQPLTAPQTGTRRHIRVGPPANDNIRLGGLRFTGLRLVLILSAIVGLAAVLRSLGAL